MDTLSARVQQMRLRDLLLLEKVAELGSLRRVAESLHVTQPAITQSLKGLEQAFGIALVDRGRSGARLTPAGMAVLTRVRAASQELREAQKAALQAESPEVRLGSSPAAMLSLVPAALAALRMSDPRVRVVLTELGVAALWDRLDDGTFDAIVTRMPNISKGKAMPQGLALTRIGQEKMVLACARKHPLARVRAKAADLAGCDWDMPPAEALAVLMLNEWFAQSGVQAPSPKVTCGSFYASLQMASCTDLLTIAPESAALALQGSLKLKLIPWGQSYLDIVFACRSSSLENPAVRALRACFR